MTTNVSKKTDKQTHYKKIYKSDHLGVADLEDFIEQERPLIFTIKEVRQEYNVKVAGRKGNFNIAYFIEGIKPLVLNVTNSKIIKKFNNNDPFVENWSMTKVKLYIDPNVKMKGELVGGVRISTIKPTNKPILTPQSKKWEDAKKSDLTFEQMNKHFSITKENYELLRK